MSTLPKVHTWLRLPAVLLGFLGLCSIHRAKDSSFNSFLVKAAGIEHLRCANARGGIV